MKHYFFSKIFCFQENIMLIFLLFRKCSELFLPSLLSGLNYGSDESLSPLLLSTKFQSLTVMLINVRI